MRSLLLLVAFAVGPGPCFAEAPARADLAGAGCQQQPGAPTTPRLQTDRPAGAALLQLPKEDDAFGFVVFGDRTGGPPEGIEVLKQAVTDTNLLDPDLVLTVGDLVNGYNAQDAWMAQAREYKAAMAKLRMPWFPVAGNHDVYWRGEGKPQGEHEGNFEREFGPLWYAFAHKQCWFVVLYSDEGDPKTGKKDFHLPECQRISEAQFAWLDRTLTQAQGARHVFVFLHHPRWLPQYGDDWQRVHTRLAKAGNVTAVFAGHIHCMRYDGVRDGIQYYTVASVGAHLGMEAPQAGFLHEFHVVTVRPQGIQVAAVPVGVLLDPQRIPGELSDDVIAVAENLRVEVASCVAAGSGASLTADGAVDALVTLRAHNPARRAIELELLPLADAGYRFGPDHQHLIVPPGQSATTTFAVQRAADPQLPFVLPRLQVRCDYLAADRRIALPTTTGELELRPPEDLAATPAPHNGALVLDGKSASARWLPEQIELPDGPFTVEAWIRPDDLRGRRGVVARAQDSEFGLFASDGIASFAVFLGERYATAKSGKGAVKTGAWQHLAGVFDGTEVRVYVDGALVGQVAGQGARKRNRLPLFVGADTTAKGNPGSFFAGLVDDVRISKQARYQGERFTPPPRLTADADTVLWLPCDTDFGPWTADAGPRHQHARRLGTAHCTLEPRAGAR